MLAKKRCVAYPNVRCARLWLAALAVLVSRLFANTLIVFVGYQHDKNVVAPSKNSAYWL